MKKLKTTLPPFAPRIVNGATAQETAVPEVLLPPAPPQINAPVGPPPPEIIIPSDFAGLIELSKKVARQNAMTEKAQLWATLALATATNRQADLLEEIIGLFLIEEAEAEDGKEGEPIPSRVSEAIADGIALAFSGILAGSAEVQAIVAKIGKK